MSKEIIISLNKPHEAQSLVLNTAKRFNVLICGRRWGKSNLALNLLSEPSLEGYPTGYFTPTYKLLEPTYKELVDLLNPVVKRKHENQFIELITGGIIEFWSLENELAGRSRKYKRVILDEVGFAKNLKKTWNESVRATLTDYKGDAWLMSTPKGKNDLFEFFGRGQDDNDKWMSWQMPTSTNPYIDKSEIEDAKHDMPEHAFKQEYLAQFLDDGSGVFSGLTINESPSGASRYYAGIDLGRADDYTVITVLNDKGQMVQCERWRHDTWQNIVNNLLHVMRKWSAVTYIETNSIGDAIFEQLRQSYRDIEPFVTTSKSKQDIIEALQVAAQNNEFTMLNIDWLKKEFDLFTYEYSHKSRSIKYSAPLGFHDDGVMSCAIAYHAFKNLKNTGKYSFM
jgi:hypothetical protein